MYTVVIDAGSSGTRLFLYQVVPGAYPLVKKVCEQEFATTPSGVTEDGINNYVCPDDPALQRQVGPEVIAPLLQSLTPHLSRLGVSPRDVEVNLLATAGMRFAQTQYGSKHIDAFYQYISHVIDAAGFKVGQVRTIDGGAEEGLWTWVNLNDFHFDIFRTDAEPVGIVEVGGSSAQFAFPLAEDAQGADTHRIELNRKRYHIFSRSYLGLGQDDARKAMRQNAGDLGARVCFPTGFSAAHDCGDVIDGVARFRLAADGAYDFQVCTSHYDQIIGDGLRKSGDPGLARFPGRFVGIDGAYYVARFWDIEQAPQRLESKILEHCGDVSNFADIGMTEPVQRHSANATYLNALLFGRHGLLRCTPDKLDKVIATKNGSHTELTWTRGYLLLRHVV